jgi:hypothetical protein
MYFASTWYFLNIYNSLFINSLVGFMVKWTFQKCRLKFSSICILIKGSNSTVDFDLRSSIMDNILWVFFFKFP